MAPTREQAIAELERRKQTQSTPTQQQAIAELERRNSQPQKRKANILDLIGLTGTSMATTGGREIAEAGSGMLGNIPKAIPAVKESLQPETPAEKYTLAGANIAGAMSPVSPLNLASAKVATAIPKALGGGKLAQGLGYATAGALENTAWMPEETEEYLDPKKMAERAGVGAMFGVGAPAVLGGLSATTRNVGKALKKAPKKLVDEVIATKHAHLKFGKDPARAILSKKIKSKDFVGLDDLYDNVSTELSQTGDSLSQAYKQSTDKFDVTDEVINPIMETLQELKADRPEQSKAQMSKIESIFSDIGLHKTQDLTAQEAWELQRKLGGWVNWTTVDDAEKAGNLVIRDMYRNIRNKLEKSMPELRQLNQDYSDLLTASKAIEQRNPVLQRQNVFSPSALATGLATGVAEGATTGFDLGTIVAGLGSALTVQASKAPSFKLNLAHAINNAGVQKVADVMEKSPSFKKSFMAMYGTMPDTVDEMVDTARRYVADYEQSVPKGQFNQRTRQPLQQGLKKKGELRFGADPKQYKTAKEYVEAQPTVYHGTGAEFDNFDVKESATGAIWFTDRKDFIEGNKVGASSKGRIVERVIPEDMKLAGWKEYDKYTTDELIREGYDGLALVEDDQTTYSIFFPEKLKTPKQLASEWKQVNASS